MKWVSPRDGVYKYVQDDYDAPEVIPPDKKGIPSIITKVPWANLEAGIHQEDNHKQIEATDQFLAERSSWTSTSHKLRKWEKDRKQEWAKNKPAWRKEQMKKGAI